MFGLGGGGSELYFFENRPLPLAVWVVLPVLVGFQTFLSSTPHPHYRVRFGGGGGGALREPPSHFGAGEFKKICLGEGWDSGRAVRGQSYENMGYNIIDDRILPGVLK